MFLLICEFEYLNNDQRQATKLTRIQLFINVDNDDDDDNIQYKIIVNPLLYNMYTHNR